MITEQLITYNTAVLAKEKGFDIKSSNAWYDNGVAKCRIVESNTLFDTEYYAPTQSLLQRWLREKHGIIIELLVDGWEEHLCYRIFIWQKSRPKPSPQDDYGAMSNYEDALEIALQEALALV